MYPRAVIHGIRASPVSSFSTSISAPIPPVLTINWVNSRVCFTMSLVKAAAFLRTWGHACAICIKTEGNTSASTTTSASSDECLAHAPEMQNLVTSSSTTSMLFTEGCQDLSLQFLVQIVQVLGQVGYGPCVHDILRQFDAVFGYIGQSAGRDLLQAQVGPLQRHD
jgi:hypothetical protein